MEKAERVGKSILGMLRDLFTCRLQYQPIVLMLVIYHATDLKYILCNFMYNFVFSVDCSYGSYKI